jgi:hypothetical protein
MTAAAANRSAPEIKLPRSLVGKFALLNDAVMYAGTMLARDYAGEVQAAADTAGLKVIGSCPLGMDNAADGLQTIVDQVIRLFENDTTSPVTRSLIGKACFVVDDQTVGGKTTNMVAAGIVYDVTADGVFVDQRAEALALAETMVPFKFVDKTDDYTVTAAIAFEGRTIFKCDKASIMEITLPSAVAGMRVGVQRTTATAAHDVSIQAATGDKVLGSAAGKQVDNTTDAVSGILILQAADATDWIAVNPIPADLASWVINDA